MKDKIIKSVKRQEEEKIGLSLKVPVSLKNKLQEISERESIPINSLAVATLQSMIDDDCGKQISLAKTLLTDYKVILERAIEDLKDYGIDSDNIRNYEKMTSNLSQINNFLREE